MFVGADLAIYNRNYRLAVVADVRNKLGTSPEWAAGTRRNMIAHGRPCGADFFIIVTPDRLYLWKDAGAEPVEIPPTYIADARPEFAPYFESAGIDPRTVSGYAFELLVSSWLGDIIRSESLEDESADGRSWLVESGLHAAVRGGRIEHETTA